MGPAVEAEDGAAGFLPLLGEDGKARSAISCVDHPSLAVAFSGLISSVPATGRPSCIPVPPSMSNLLQGASRLMGRSSHAPVSKTHPGAVRLTCYVSAPPNPLQYAKKDIKRFATLSLRCHAAGTRIAA